jgi:hypothetical protein
VRDSVIAGVIRGWAVDFGCFQVDVVLLITALRVASYYRRLVFHSFLKKILLLFFGSRLDFAAPGKNEALRSKRSILANLSRTIETSSACTRSVCCAGITRAFSAS